MGFRAPLAGLAGASLTLLLVACVKYTDADPATDSANDDSTVRTAEPTDPVPAAVSDAGAAVDAATAPVDAGASVTVDGSATTTLVTYDTMKLCNFDVTTCKDDITLHKCMTTYGVEVFTPDCVAKLDAAIAAGDCNDFLNGTTNAVCFPTCNGGVNTCNGDGTMDICNSQNLFGVQDCNLTCQQAGETFSGTCGKTFDGRSSTEDVCWCVASN